MGEKGTLSRMGRMARQLEEFSGQFDLGPFATLSDFQFPIISHATAQFLPANRGGDATLQCGTTAGAGNYMGCILVTGIAPVFLMPNWLRVVAVCQPNHGCQ